MRNTKKEISRFREIINLNDCPQSKAQRLQRLQEQVDKMKAHGISKEIAKELLSHGVWLSNEQMHNWLLKEWEKLRK